MRFLFVLTFAFVFATGGAPAQAASCKASGSKEATELKLNFADDKTMEGLGISLQFALTPAEFPENEIRAAVSPCSRGSFRVGDRMFELFGDDGDSPPRWATASNETTIMFIAYIPRPEAALAWFERSKRTGNRSATFDDKEIMTALVMTTGDEKRPIFAFFDRVPDDDRLKAMMQEIGTQKRRSLLSFDVKTLDVVTSPN